VEEEEEERVLTYASQPALTHARAVAPATLEAAGESALEEGETRSPEAVARNQTGLEQ